MIGKDPIETRLQRYFDDADRQPPEAGLESRIIRAAQDGSRRGVAWSAPRQVAAAAAVAILGIGLAASLAYLRAHQASTANGPGPDNRSIGLSIGTQGGGDWIVIRGIDIGSASRLSNPTTNIAYHTGNGGQSWQDRLHFQGIYDGMSWSRNGQSGVVWVFDNTTPCGTAQTCTIPSSRIYTFYASSDGGLHWTSHQMTLGNFADIYFAGSDGWVLSRQDYAVGQTPTYPTLYRTSDGGATWSKVSELPDFTGMQLSGGIWGHTSGVGETNLIFANAQHGWLATGLEGVNGHGGLLETTDGGKTWHDMSVNLPAALSSESAVLGYPVLLENGRALLPVFFGRRTDINTFSIDHRYIYSSSDYGSTWNNPQPLRANGLEPTGNEWQQYYLDANHWWFTTINQRTSGEPVAQAGPGIARTSDGGKTWQTFQNKTSPIIEQMTFTDAKDGWAFAIAGPNDTTNVLMRTTDGGAHWSEVAIP